jgi:uncharacterized protein (DUF1778 family)
MAAQLKPASDQDQWSETVTQEGLNKLAQAIAQPKQPNEALKRLMAQYKPK